MESDIFYWSRESEPESNFTQESGNFFYGVGALDRSRAIWPQTPEPGGVGQRQFPPGVVEFFFGVIVVVETWSLEIYRPTPDALTLKANDVKKIVGDMSRRRCFN